MSEHTATVRWERAGAAFSDNKYSRAHIWEFDEGVAVPASASPDVVPLPMSNAAAVDPEEAFVASLASCHMLFFLSIAQKRGYVVDSYVDPAVGWLGKNTAGRHAVTRVVLRPTATYVGKTPPAEELDKMHHRSHELCFIANSVTTDVALEVVS
ncbi:MAG: OsmC family protein [Pseudomonadota bacterium]